MNKTNKIKTRFAPSPTGNLHLGNIKSAIISWAYANKKRGNFILRIDDTDKKRSKNKYVKNIIKNLKWLGLDFKKIYFQSKRKKIYFRYLKKIIKKGKVLKRKDGSMEYLINKNKNIKWFENKKKIEIKNIENFTILRRNKTFTYNFSSAIDDIDMKITHVFRGVDHINNTAKQIDIINSIKKKKPKYFHFSNITNNKGQKLSKRFSLKKNINYFKSKGFLSNCIFNYVSNLGTENKNFYDKKIYISKLNINNLKKSPSKFNSKLLLRYNNFYIKKEMKKICMSLKKKDLLIFKNFYSRIYKLSEIRELKKKIKIKNKIYIKKTTFFIIFELLKKIGKIKTEEEINLLFYNLKEKKQFFKIFRSFFKKKIKNLPILKSILSLGNNFHLKIITKVLFI